MTYKRVLVFSGVVLVLALAASAGVFVLSRPSRPAYIEATPEPVVASLLSDVDATSAPPSAAPTAAADDGTIALADRALIVAPRVFPGQGQIAQSTPIIVSFSAQGGEMQDLCAQAGGVLDSGLCSVRTLAVASVDSAGVHVALTASQAQTLARVRAAGVALVVAADNAVLMATTTVQQPAAATPTASMGEAAPTAAAQAQRQPTVTFVDGLPLLPIALGAVLLLAIAGLVVMRRRGGRSGRPATPGRAKIALPRRSGKAPAAAGGPPAGLTLNLGNVAVTPLLDDDAAAAVTSEPRVTGAVFVDGDDVFPPGVGVAPFLSATEKPFADAPASASPPGAPAQAGGDVAAFLPADDDLLAAEPAAPARSGGALSGADTVFGAWPEPGSAAGLLDDLPAEPPIPMEPVIPRLGPPLPPAKPAEPLPPPAALDREAALRWVKQPGS